MNVVNSFHRDFKELTATARIYNLDMTEMYSNQTTLSIASDGVIRLFNLPEVPGLSTTYFVKLTLQGVSGRSKCRQENSYRNSGAICLLPFRELRRDALRRYNTEPPESGIWALAVLSNLTSR